MLSFLGIALGPRVANTNTPDSLQWESLASFVQAQALAVDPQGRLYVADAGRHVVVRLSAEGQIEAIIGGPGRAPGQFDTPLALYVGAGLRLWVAEAGNHRLQRLTWQGTPLEVIPLPESVMPTGVYAQGRQVWVLDAQGAALWQRLSDGRWQKMAQGMHQPIALAPGSGGRLFVADAGQNKVLAYDALGVVERLWIETLPAKLQALTAFGDTLWMVLDHQLYRHVPAMGLEPWGAAMLQVVGLAVHHGIVYVLTPTRLYKGRQFKTPGRR